MATGIPLSKMERASTLREIYPSSFTAVFFFPTMEKHAIKRKNLLTSRRIAPTIPGQWRENAPRIPIAIMRERVWGE